VTNVEKVFGKEANTSKALEDISFTIIHGEFVGITEPSDAGKSTLLRVLAKMDALLKRIFI